MNFHPATTRETSGFRTLAESARKSQAIAGFFGEQRLARQLHFEVGLCAPVEAVCDPILFCVR
jgi:hypothetical protein